MTISIRPNGAASALRTHHRAVSRLPHRHAGADVRALAKRTASASSRKRFFRSASCTSRSSSAWVRTFARGGDRGDPRRGAALRRAGDGQRPARVRRSGPRGAEREGITEVNRVYHIDRGYEHLDEKLNELGARLSGKAGFRSFPCSRGGRGGRWTRKKE